MLQLLDYLIPLWCKSALIFRSYFIQPIIVLGLWQETQLEMSKEVLALLSATTLVYKQLDMEFAFVYKAYK